MERTIAAIATALGKGGISIIRISGADAVKIADSVFSKDILNVQSHTIHYGFIHDNGEQIDQVLVSVMKAPKTYTGEDVVEINCHGGITVTNRVLNTVISKGADMAEPGEFTKRAFLNGKIDLSQAEAVIDIINAENDMAQNNAFGQLKGKLSEEISTARDAIIKLSARMQVAIDYPDEDLEDITPEEIEDILKECRNTTTKLLKQADNGKIITDGITAAIVGKPNVGKSSLLNCLSKSSRAIVTDIAGTTRDTIEERVNLDGVPLILVDTAGIRETDDTVEKIGVERSKQSIEDADILFVMLDAKSGITPEDEEILRETESKNRVVLVNKTDVSDFDDSLLPNTQIIKICAKTGNGIDKLSEILKEKYNIGELSKSKTPVITNARQKRALNLADEALSRAIHVIASGQPQDLAALDIYDAADRLGEITGQTVSDDIVTSIFHDFCVGK